MELARDTREGDEAVRIDYDMMLAMLWVFGGILCVAAVIIYFSS